MAFRGSGAHVAAGATSTYLEMLEADRFQSQAGGTFGNTNGFPRWRMANAADTQLVAITKLPKGYALSPNPAMATISLVVARPAGAVAAGNAQFGQKAIVRKAGDTLSAYSAPPTFAYAIGAETASVVLVELSLADAASFIATVDSRFVWVVVRRDATAAGDTFEDLLDFLGIVVQWTVS